MTRILLFAATLALAAPLALPSIAKDEPSGKIAAAFGNTVLSIYPDGRSQKIWLKEDGSWTGLSRRGNPLAGNWTAKGDQVCLKQTHPPIPFFKFCQTLPDDPETGIDSKDLGGTKIHLKLVKGHVTKAES
ncbi:hypothetical protein [Phenylobacterium sp.]|jgi:hypothetical protein|uniref:hypothetical protein n=1 Tax=Phenylobacterium sp. TaxID=1871053 RepID=UPI002F41F324